MKDQYANDEQIVQERWILPALDPEDGGKALAADSPFTVIRQIDGCALPSIMVYDNGKFALSWEELDDEGEAIQRDTYTAEVSLDDAFKIWLFYSAPAEFAEKVRALI